MKLKKLWYLQHIISTGSFAAAARETGVSQPAITQAMQTLENEWGIPLFEKLGRQKLPTRAALAIAQQAADLHGQLEKLAHPASDDIAEVTQALRVGMAPAAALLYGAAIESIWRQHEPEGLLQIVSGSAPELLTALQQGELDLVAAPRPRRYQAEGIEQLPLHMSMPTIYARIGHPLSSATSLNEIERAGWVVSGRGGTAGNVIEEAHRVRRLPAPRILVQCADYMTVLEFVAMSDMLCVVPHPVLLQEKHHESVRALHIREGLPQYEVCLFWKAPENKMNNMLIGLILSALKEQDLQSPPEQPARKSGHH